MKINSAFSKNNSGMTMVEVLMGFVILLLLLGMLSGIISTATKIYYSSVDLRRAEESLQKVIYSDSAQEKAENQNVVLKLVPSDGMPDSDSKISMSAGLFNLSSKESADESDGEVMDIDVFFMKEPPKNDFQGN